MPQRRVPVRALKEIADAIAAERSMSGATVEVGRAQLVSTLRERIKTSPELARYLAEVQRGNPMSAPLGRGPGASVIRNSGPVFRAAYLIQAARRIAEADDEAEQKGNESRYFRQHQGAQIKRELGAMRLDAAQAAHGRTLGWYATLDERTTAECRAAHGKNFDIRHPPVIGLPGIGPHHGCRCTPGAPHARADFLPSGTPEDALPGTMRTTAPPDPRTVAATADAPTTEPDPTRTLPELPDWTWWPPAQPVPPKRYGPDEMIELVSGDTSPFSSSTTSNWVARRGGLPPRVRAIARAVKRKHPSWPLGRCIAVAINMVKHSAATGDVKGLPGRQNERPSTVAAHSAAAAHWAAMKGKRGKGKRKVKTTAETVAAVDLSASWDTVEQRRAWARKGIALPDGSFPIPNVAFLRKAIHAYGRAGNKARAKAHIIRRARALGATNLLPEGWS